MQWVLSSVYKTVVESKYFDRSFLKYNMSERGVSDLWSSANHIAIVVSNVGKSLGFYTDVVGMKQIFRPKFDRYRKAFNISYP